jgi:HEAT repeat protein
VDESSEAFLKQNSEAMAHYLRRDLYKSDNVFWKPYECLRGYAPTWFAKKMPVWWEPRLVRGGAGYWLAQLGPKAAICAPRLRELGNEDRYADVRQSALWALGRVDGPSKESLSTVIRAVTNDPDPAVRRTAAGVLEIWKSDDPEVIPVFTKGLNDSDPSVQQISAAALGSYGWRASAAIEPLKKLAAEGGMASGQAEQALKDIQKPTASP